MARALLTAVLTACAVVVVAAHAAAAIPRGAPESRMRPAGAHRCRTIAAYVDLGFAMFHTGRHERALEIWVRAADANGRMPVLDALIAVALWKLDRRPAALERVGDDRFEHGAIERTARTDLRWSPEMQGLLAEILAARHGAPTNGDGIVEMNRRPR